MAFFEANKSMSWIVSNKSCKFCEDYPYFTFLGNNLILYCECCGSIYFQPEQLFDESESQKFDYFTGCLVGTTTQIIPQNWRTATHEEIKHSRWASYEGQTIEVKESNFK